MVTFNETEFSKQLQNLAQNGTVVVETEKGRFEFTKKPQNPKAIQEFSSALKQTHELGEFVGELGTNENMSQSEMGRRLSSMQEHLAGYEVNGKSATDMLRPFKEAQRRGNPIDQKALHGTMEDIYYNGSLIV